MFRTSRGTSSIELGEWLRKHVPDYRGIYMGNQTLPSPLPNGSYLVNIGSMSEGGTHWACFKLTNKTAYYFDPIGLWPTEEHTKNIKGSGRKMLSSDSQWQNPKDTVDSTCGQRSVTALYQMRSRPASAFKLLSS